MEPVRIALLGLGWVGAHRHIPAILANPALKLIGVADRRPGVAQAIGRQFEVPHAQCDQVGQLPWLNDMDALDIATSPGAHHELIGQALDAGKHVITEKPFCLRLEDARRLVDQARSAQRTLAIVHNFQFASSCRQLRQDLDSGRLGKVRSVSAVQWGNAKRRLPTWYEELPLGLFFDESPHLLYLLRAFSPGPLAVRHMEVYKSTTGHRTPAAVEALYEASTPYGKVPVSMSCKFESAVSEWYVSVHGDDGVGIVDVFRDIYIRLPNDGAHGTLDVLKTSWHTFWQHAKAHLVNGPLHLRGRLLYGNEEVFSRFAQSVQSGRPPAGIDATDALAVLQMQHDIIAHG